MQVQSTPTAMNMKSLAAKAKAMKNKAGQSSQAQNKDQAGMEAQLKAKLAQRAQEKNVASQTKAPVQSQNALSAQDALALRNQMAGKV
ncbi:MAG: hypothetical protein WEB87_06460 [Bacteriovoracaceae bacterium]